MKTKTQKQLIVVSIISFVVTVFLLTSTIFAWVSLSRQAGSSFISNLTDISSDFEFYIYRDSDFNGSGNKLITDECVAIDYENCFENIPNPKVSQIINPEMKPSDRISFALKIINKSSMPIDIRLSFGGISSTGYNEDYNKIQRAFMYEVTAIRYLNGGIEGDDIKSSANIINAHFESHEVSHYVLLNNFELSKNGTLNDRAVIYFDLYFDENIFGLNDLLESTGNSNVFMNQTLVVNNFYIELDV